jgi:hypothetical protein
LIFYVLRQIREGRWSDGVNGSNKNGENLSEEGLRKIRRKIEDLLRKDKSLILKVADFLGIRYDKNISNNKHG